MCYALIKSGVNRGKQCTNKNAMFSSFCGKHQVLSKGSPKNRNGGSPRQKLSHAKYLESKHVKEALSALKAAGITPKKSPKKSAKKKSARKSPARPRKSAKK
jgi:hypothetical protein